MEREKMELERMILEIDREFPIAESLPDGVIKAVQLSVLHLKTRELYERFNKWNSEYGEEYKRKYESGGS